MLLSRDLYLSFEEELYVKKGKNNFTFSHLRCMLARPRQPARRPSTRPHLRPQAAGPPVLLLPDTRGSLVTGLSDQCPLAPSGPPPVALLVHRSGPGPDRARAEEESKDADAGDKDWLHTTPPLAA